MSGWFKRLFTRGSADRGASRAAPSCELPHSEVSAADASSARAAGMISGRMDEDIDAITARFGSAPDLSVRRYEGGGARAAIILIDNLVGKNDLALTVTSALSRLSETALTGMPLYTLLRDERFSTMEQNETRDLDRVCLMLMSGFAVVLVDGAPDAIVVGAQRLPDSGIHTLEEEGSIAGSHDSFCELLRQNVALLRRSLKSTDLRFASMRLGTASNTEVVMCYMEGAADAALVEEIKRRLSGVDIDILLDPRMLKPYITEKPYSVFSEVGGTVRPDIMAVKLVEGRVGVLVEGSSYALILPYLFHEHLQTMDDYTTATPFGIFMRAIKVVCFVLTIILPALYVAAGSFHQELFPDTLLYSVAKDAASTPFPLMLEALMIFFFFEIMRESGLRMQKSIGGAVSIVGALILGQSAVQAGLVGAPMIIVLAITAIGSFILPSLYATLAVLRMVFVLLGGIFGLYGVMVGMLVLLINMCAAENLGTPLMSPLSPFSFKAMRDYIFRLPMPKLVRSRMKLGDMPRGGKTGG